MLPKAPLFQPKIGIIWPFSHNYHQLLTVLLCQPNIGITEDIGYYDYFGTILKV